MELNATNNIHEILQKYLQFGEIWCNPVLI